MKAAWAILVLVLALTCSAQSGWHPQKATLMTRWAADVNPTNTLPEYPRPQLTRPEWMNLNGLWDYAIAPESANGPGPYAGKILAPFPVESALSGVMTPLDPHSTLWYRRPVALPSSWRGRDVLLHFGAVDWAVRVLVNGREVGEHRGGYDPFTFNIGPELKPAQEQELVVAVSDPTEGDQPRGKQSRKPEGIFYTQTSGIWQTVWLEPVPEIFITGLDLMPDAEANVLRLRVNVSSDASDLQVTATAAGATISGKANAELVLPIAHPHYWTPDDPYLYDLKVKLGRDEVCSYFGLRSVALERGSDGVTRITLNGQPLFQLGALDQGFWPDGLYTAPTDAALRHDLEFLKSAGFNLVRKHVKVEPERWYYWCDRIGLLVWQDMPSGNNNGREGRAQFEAELLRMIKTLRNHPSIIMWVLFNEGWGQYNTEQLVSWIKSIDSSRLVDNASGWTDMQTGDVVDNHSYPDPEAPAPEDRRASVLGEFGGLGLIIPGHSWPQPWAYQMLPDTPGLLGWYSHVLNEIWNQKESRGLCAAVYTQTADVENECNGLQTYDRAVTKLSPEWLAQINSGRAHRAVWNPLMTNALYGKPMWKYRFDPPPSNWSTTGYDDASGWKEGPGGFGTAFTRGSHVNTVWDTPEIWLRRVFVLPPGNYSRAKFQLHHDKDAEVYLNGVPAFRGMGYLVDYAIYDLPDEARATLHPGRNTIAVHCRQTAGGQFIDVGIVEPGD